MHTTEGEALMISNISIEALAYRVASQAHANQTDKIGEPYMGHILRVRGYTGKIPIIQGIAYKENISMSLVRIVALLHDTIEDTEITAIKLMELGIPIAAVDAICVMSRNKSETYQDYIQTVAKHPIGSIVKLADLTDNMDPSRLCKFNSEKLAGRYKKAYATIYNSLERRLNG